MPQSSKKSATQSTASPTSSPAEVVKQEYTLTVYTENHVGLLSRIAIIFSRRKINVESLNTSPSEVNGVHRFNIVIVETEEVVRKLCRQIEKQVEVLEAYYNTQDETVWQELALYKVPTAVIAAEVKVERLLRKYGAKAVVIRTDYTVFEVTGHREETDAMVRYLEPFGLIEFVRTARVAIIKDSDGFHQRLKEFERREPSEHEIQNEFLSENQQIFNM